jgi:tetratricopeptide (TPR) repeat protein
MPRIFLQFYFLIACLLGLQISAYAIEWQEIDGTTRYKISFDEESIRLTPKGRLEVWLRFIPRGEAERKIAALEYKDKRYRSHLEYYEIDCSDQTALLGLVNVLGQDRVRLKQLLGGTEPEPILPGSVLENAAKRICPSLDEEVAEENEIEEEPEVNSEAATNNDRLQEIDELRKKAAAKNAPAEAWKELGNIYFDTDQPQLAIKAYQRALILKPDDTDILNDQGAMYRQIGDFKKALANFEKANRVDPNNLESLYNRGYVYAFDLNQISKALVIWRRYLELESKSETALQVQSFIEKYGSQP